MAVVSSELSPSNTDEFIRSLKKKLNSIDPYFKYFIDFRYEVQKDNLMSLVSEASIRLDYYENIYPYIKELCRDQIIDPTWYGRIELVLNWALSKGRGSDRKKLSEDLRNVWVTYVVVLSCAMIDKKPENRKIRRNILLRGGDEDQVTIIKGSK